MNLWVLLVVAERVVVGLLSGLVGVGRDGVDDRLADLLERCLAGDRVDARDVHHEVIVGEAPATEGTNLPGARPPSIESADLVLNDRLLIAEVVLATDDNVDDLVEQVRLALEVRIGLNQDRQERIASSRGSQVDVLGTTRASDGVLDDLVERVGVGLGHVGGLVGLDHAVRQVVGPIGVARAERGLLGVAGADDALLGDVPRQTEHQHDAGDDHENRVLLDPAQDCFDVHSVFLFCVKHMG